MNLDSRGPGPTGPEMPGASSWENISLRASPRLTITHSMTVQSDLPSRDRLKNCKSICLTAVAQTVVKWSATDLTPFAELQKSCTPPVVDIKRGLPVELLGWENFPPERTCLPPSIPACPYLPPRLLHGAKGSSRPLTSRDASLLFQGVSQTTLPHRRRKTPPGALAKLCANAAPWVKR